ncbi:hypothetical protein ACU8KH_02562 [Lachancea thermotolerans]
MVLSNQYIALFAKIDAYGIDIFRPFVCVSHFDSPNSIEVMHMVGSMSSAIFRTWNCGRWISISDGASDPGASWKVNLTPSNTSVSRLFSILIVGADQRYGSQCSSFSYSRINKPLDSSRK